MSRIPGGGGPPPKSSPGQVVDSKYMADFNALNAAEEAAAVRNAHNQSAQTERPKGESVKDESPLLAAVDLDENRKRKRRDPNEAPIEDDDALEQAAAQLGMADGKARYFETPPADAMGDLDLVDPNEMRRKLGPSVRFAQHAMLLAEARRQDGLPRSEAIAYLAEFFLRCNDRVYALKAVRDFGPATGIIDIYPLELIDHLLDHSPDFLQGVARGHFVAHAPTTAFKGQTGEAILVEYPADLRIRGFAIKGGGRVGYTFEPVDPIGHHEARFDSPGRFEVLVSALGGRGSKLVVDTLWFEIEGEQIEPPEPTTAEPRKQDLSFSIRRRI